MKGFGLWILLGTIIVVGGVAWFVITEDAVESEEPEVVHVPEQSEAQIEARLNEEKTALGVSITPLEIISDSRCPIDVQCVWAGTVEVKATLVSSLGTAEQIFKLNDPVTTGAEEITLLRVDPAPKAGVEIKPTEYVFTFEVKRR